MAEGPCVAAAEHALAKHATRLTASSAVAPRLLLLQLRPTQQAAGAAPAPRAGAAVVAAWGFPLQLIPRARGNVQRTATTLLVAPSINKRTCPTSYARSG